MDTSHGQPLRICHLGKYYPPAPGGIETHVQVLARAQAQLGASVQVACVNHASPAGRDLTWSRRGMTVTTTEDDQGVRVTRLGRSVHAAKLDLVPDLSRFFRKHSSADILHLHTPNPTMLLALAAMRPRTPLVITHHSDVVQQKYLYPVFQPFESLVYRKASRVISNSPMYADGSERLRAMQGVVHTIPMGLSLDPFLNPSPKAMQFAAELRAQHGGPLWLAVGRCVYYKGFHVALSALREVPGKLVLVGQGPFKEDLIRLSHQLGVADRVVWVPYLDQHELVGAYQAATAFWFPSNARSEAFGLVQVEAMASRCPVINTSIPCSGVAWVSGHEQTGLTVPVEDAAAFAAAARRLLADQPLRDRLATAGRQRAVECFSDQTMASRTLELYADILHERQRVICAVPGRSATRTPTPAAAPTRALKPFGLTAETADVELRVAT